MYKKNNSHFQIPLTSHLTNYLRNYKKASRKHGVEPSIENFSAELTRRPLRFCMQIVPQGPIFLLMFWLAWSF